MTYQAIAFFDLDGTLLDNQAKITPEIVTAMQQLRDNHVLPIIATGRTESEIHEVKKLTGITSNIVMNGAFVRVNGQEIASRTLDTKLLQTIYDASQVNNDHLAFYNPNGYFATGHNEDMEKAYKFVHAPLPEIRPLVFQEQPINMLLILGQDNDQYYADRFPELTLYRNTPYSIDAVLNGTSKGTGVELVKEALQLKNIPTYAFGDGMNDIALFGSCDYKIAMGNAKPQLKELADFVTKTNDNHGIVHALKHFSLI